MSNSDITAEKLLSDQLWRLSHLYHIIDKRGQKIRFELNSAQQAIFDDLFYQNIVLKSRQMGITTFFSILLLDVALFNSNTHCGIIADTEENAKYIFRKIKFAYDCLPDQLKNIREAKIDSAKELTFNNNSLIRVGTSLRSATFQYLLISEFGKIASEDIKRANEIQTGSLNTVALGSYVFIESTPRGRGGLFYDMCIEAKKSQDAGKELTEMDYRFHFLPWWQEPGYRLGSAVHISEEMHEYFLSLSAKGIELDQEQRNWYCAKYASQGDNMTREFPSTAEECWQVSNEGLYYGKQINLARLEKRIGHVAHDETALVHTAWDLGISDETAIWFFQVIGREIHVIDYLEGSGESLAHWIKIVSEKPYTYDKHLCPHDILNRELSSGLSRQVTARKLGINLIAVPRIAVISGIDAARNLLARCWFDERKCAQGLKCLENYKKLWNERNGCWHSEPNHDWSSHGSDAFRILAGGLCYITGQTSQVDLERSALESQRDQSGLLPGHYLYSGPQKAPAVNTRTLGHASTQAARSGRGEHPGSQTFMPEIDARKNAFGQQQRKSIF